MKDFFGYLFIIYLMLHYANNSNGYALLDRDITFSPNKQHRQIGKTLYFNPNDYYQNSFAASEPKLKTNSSIVNQVLWEVPLKYAMYLVMNNKVDEKESSSDTISKDIIDNAEYFRPINKEKVQRFGDIILLARGRFEGKSNGQYRFIEMNGREHCNQNMCTLNELINKSVNKNVTAFWLIEKIRHRDQLSAFRYELKFTIWPIKKRKLIENKRAATNYEQVPTKVRNFYIRDKDYPNYFKTTLPSTAEEQPHKIQKRIFNIGTDTNSIAFNVNPTDLNTGEYYTKPSNYYYFNPSADHFAPTSIHTSNRNIRFPQNEFTDLSDSQQFTETHLHHHYYLNKNNVPLVKASAYEKEEKFHYPESFNSVHNFANYPSLALYDQNTKNNDYQHTEYLSEPLSLPISDGGYSSFNIEPTRQTYHHYKHKEENYQTPFTHTDQLEPVVPVNNQAYQPYNIYQIIQPPYFNQQSHVQDPLPTTPHSLDDNRQFFTPHNYYNLQDSIIASKNPPQALFPPQHGEFIGNEKYEQFRYSEADPINHEFIDSPRSSYPYNQELLNSNDVFGIQQHQQIRFLNKNQTDNEKQTDNNNTNEYVSDEPDIIYNKNESKHNRTVERNKTEFPDSINAQLPPPDQHDDITVPYVESSDNTERAIELTSSRNKKPSEEIVSRNRFTAKPVCNSTHIARISTTEKPILRWMPKKHKVTTQPPPLGHQLYSDDEAKTTEPSIIANEPDEESPANNNGSSIKTAAEPSTVLPGVDIIHAQIKPISTNISDIKLFKATENTQNDDVAAKEERIINELEKSIVQHASNL